MKRWYVVTLFVFAGVLWLRPAPAQAALHICNKVQKPIYVAVGTSDASNDQSQGWWLIQPGDCKTPLGGSLDTTGATNYYFWAHSDDNTMTWSGEGKEHEFFCTIDDPFTINGCEQGTRRSFRRIDTQGYSDFTFSVTE
jgi:uncharacterized membrane protein